MPFTARTALFGSISLLVGPFTPERRACLWAMRAWCRSGLRVLRISVDLDGVENVPSGRHAYASNHQSLLDTLLLGATLPGDLKWAVKSNLMAIPFVGWHLWLAGHVRVDRSGDRRAAVTAVERFTEVLERGKPLLVFPEGTRSRDGQVKPFKMGLFYAAVRARASVVPVAVHGTGVVMAKGAADMEGDGRGGARRVYVRIGPALAPRRDGPEGTLASDLRDRTRAAVIEMHQALVRAEREGRGARDSSAS